MLREYRQFSMLFSADSLPAVLNTNVMITSADVRIRGRSMGLAARNSADPGCTSARETTVKVKVTKGRAALPAVDRFMRPRC